MVKVSVRRLQALIVMVASIGVMATRDCHAGSVTISPGYDLTRTGTAYLAYPDPDPLPNIKIPFTGVPLNTFAFPGVVPSPSFVGITDTIVHRMSQIELAEGETKSTPIEIVALNLYTNFMGVDLYATLSAIPSVGIMDITYEGVDPNTGIDGGSWTNDFTVYVDIHIGSVLGPLFDTVVKHFHGHGDWSVTPQLGNLIIDGVNKDGNFWLVGPAFHDDGSGSVHIVNTPEPSSAALLISGVLVAGFCRYRRFKS